MNRTTTKYAANDLGDDLLNGLAEIEADTRDTLEAIPAAEYNGGEWEALRNALKEARETLDAIEAMLDAKKAGKIRFIGLTNHRLGVAEEAIRSGLYDTIQFPFCYLSGEKELALVRLAKEQNVGFLAMKALSGGLITNSAAAYAFLAQFDNVLPLWGVQRDRELAEFLAYQTNPPRLTDELRAVIEDDRKLLAGDFCRGCGYCMPCPAGIKINDCARMTLMLRRAPVEVYTTPAWKEEMEKVESCLRCGKCASKCPYGLDTPTLLRRNLDDFRAFVREHNI